MQSDRVRSQLRHPLPLRRRFTAHHSRRQLLANAVMAPSRVAA
jgi:hypothetical protein